MCAKLHKNALPVKDTSTQKVRKSYFLNFPILSM